MEGLVMGFCLSSVRAHSSPTQMLGRPRGFSLRIRRPQLSTGNETDSFLGLRFLARGTLSKIPEPLGTERNIFLFNFFFIAWSVG